jgi:RNA-directed DNA polymerase
METAAGARHGADDSARNGSPILIRYADDFVVHCHTRQEPVEVKARLAAWLAPRGLAFHEDKADRRAAYVAAVPGASPRKSREPRTA